MKKNIKQPGFKFGWKSISAKPTTGVDGFYSMREWQERAFNLLKFKRKMILNAPTGSGKTKLICWVSAFQMKRDANLRCIIAVPQTIIAEGDFAESRLVMPDGEKLNWLAQHNLCKEKPTEGTINYVIKWLEGPYGFFADRVLLCTHATLVAVYKRLKETNKIQLLENLLLWVDEAHHLQNAAIEGFDSVSSNSIGELVLHLLNKTSSHVGLATASFFRGNRCDVLPPKEEKDFTRFDLPYDEYLEQMEHLRTFSFEFLVCGPDYIKAVDKIVKDKRKDIIYIPHPMSRNSTKDKYKEVDRIVESFSKVYGKSKSDGAAIVMSRKRSEFKVIDLVGEENRDEKKSYIGNVKNDKNALDAIITLGMFKEGANWIWADRVVIVGARSSLVDVIQMIGRLFRDAEGKKHVEVIQLLPFSLSQIEENFRENLNDYLKAIYACLILENILHPVKLKFKEDNKKDDNGERRKPIDWLGEELPDDAKQLALIEDISNALLEVIDSNKSANLWDEYDKLSPAILESYGITKNLDDIKKQIWGMLARQSLSVQGIDVSDIPFDLLKKENPLGFLLKYTSGSCGIDTFRHLRTAIKGRSFIPFYELREIVHEMRRKGQTLNSSTEFRIWSKNDCNYNAVIEYRKSRGA